MGNENEMKGSLSEQATQGITSAQTLLRGLIDERRALVQGIDTIRVEFVAVKEQVGGLVKLLYHGDGGNKGIVTQLALIETKLDSMVKDLEALENSTTIKFIELDKRDDKKKDRTWQLFLALIGGGGILGAIAWEIARIISGLPR